MRNSLLTLRRFVEQHEDIVMVFPVHLNPAVREVAADILGDSSRIKLIAPLDYADVLHLLGRAWLIVTDSGGVQEEAPSLGKPLLVIRENTERPVTVTLGTSRLVGNDPARIKEAFADVVEGRWHRAQPIPLWDGRAGERVAAELAAWSGSGRLVSSA